MKLTIVEKPKKDVFISLFQLLKNSASIINIIFNPDLIYIQGMDITHTCLFDIKINSKWFHSYEFDNTDSPTICLDAAFFFSILSMNNDKDQISIHYNGTPDHLHIEIVNPNKLDFNKYFKIQLCDLTQDLLEIPDTADVDVDFTISAKKIQELCSQLLLFGDNINIQCSEENIQIGSTGINGEMNVHINMDDLSEYSISEGEHFEMSYSLNTIYKMCLTTKLSNEIQLSFSKETPMCIKYDLGENSRVLFYVAPKITD